MADNSLKKGRYTKYSNKIGLFSNSKGSFIKNDTDVVLNFPFKDTVLEAGMSKEDVGREERFLHIEVDSKDIDTLEEPKVLTDFKLVDKNGEKQLTANDDIEFFDEEDNLKQNLLIKGNNLLALHTLTSRLSSQVKLIYIDPPYNTGGDGFKYNDKFNHSAWLAFMKNRLEIARELLRDDGFIFVNCDDNEQAYLKVLMDEIFNRENFISCAIWQHSVQGKNDAKTFSLHHNYLLVYAKTQEASINKLRREDKHNVNYSNPDNDPKGMWRSGDVRSPNPRENLKFDIETPSGSVISPPEKGWRWSKQKVLEKIASGEIVFSQDEKKIIRKIYLADQDGRVPETIWHGDEAGTTREASNELKALFNNLTDFSTPKPEKLIERIIQIGSKENDIVLDFCLGSGTTSAVAHKTNRRWVGIEQMDYIEEIAKERLKKVVEGEQGGISKLVKWQGGGSFVYFELKKYNQEYVDRITQATSLSELEDIYVEMRNNAFLKFWFDRKEFEKDENFRNLDIEKRKQKLVDVLDENQLYLNYADMHDTRHKVNEDEKALTDKFYGTAEN